MSSECVWKEVASCLLLVPRVPPAEVALTIDTYCGTGGGYTSVFENQYVGQPHARSFTKYYNYTKPGQIRNQVKD
jgi:hypothetical protein